MSKELWLPSSFERNNHRKAPPPKLGPSYGAWGIDAAGLHNARLPGGSTLQFDLSRLTLADYRQMRNHYQMNATQQVLRFTMHQLDWWIECEDPRIADRLETNLRQVWSRLIRAVSQAYWAGFSPIALEYENDPLTMAVKINKFKDLVPEDCSVNWKQVDGAYPVGTAGAGVPSKHHVYDGIKQAGVTGHIPKEQTLWYPLLMENGDMRGTKLMAPAFPSYFFSQLIHLFANRYFERFGEPIVVARAPFEDDVPVGNGQTMTGREIAGEMIQNLRSHGGLILPNDRSGDGNGDKDDYEYTADFLESQLRGVDFDRYMNRLDEEMSLAMFVPILLFRTADVGSYNLGQAHERTFAFQVNGLAGDLAEYIDRYLLSPLTDYNFSPRAPRARFVFRRMGKDRDETIRAILQSSIQQEQLRPDIDELGLALGMQLHEIRQVSDPTTGELVPSNDPNTEGTNDGETVEGNPLADSPNTNLAVDRSIQRLHDHLAKLERQGVPLTEANLSIGFKNQIWDGMVRDGFGTESEVEAKVRSAFGRTEMFLKDFVARADRPADQIRDAARDMMVGQLTGALW